MSLGLSQRRLRRQDAIRALSVVTTVDPTAIDDGEDGYLPGTRWLNRLASKEFVLIDGAIGAAVWQEVTGGAGGGGSVSVTDEGAALTSGLTALDFVGAGVSASHLGGGSVRVTVSGVPAGSAGGDLAGTYPSPTVKQVSPVSAALDYDVQGRLETITTGHGTKTFAYDVQGRLESIAGTGIYADKTFSYDVNGALDAVTVA
jgi:YD repeat-containing protein